MTRKISLCFKGGLKEGDHLGKHTLILKELIFLDNMKEHTAKIVSYCSGLCFQAFLKIE